MTHDAIGASIVRMRLDMRPLAPDTWSDLEDLFSRPGGAQVRGCWCMYYRVSGRQQPALSGREAAARNKRALRALVDAGTVPGLLGYRAGRAIGWVSLGPREEYAKLARSPVMKPVDDRPVWSIVCFFVDAHERGTGVAAALLDGALAWARENGVRLVEAYPFDRQDRADDDAMWFGTKSMYDRAGFVEVARRKPTRAVMRRTLRAGKDGETPFAAGR